MRLTVSAVSSPIAERCERVHLNSDGWFKIMVTTYLTKSSMFWRENCSAMLKQAEGEEMLSSAVHAI